MEGGDAYGTRFLAQGAVDGDRSTRWSSERTDPQWLEVDLGGPTEVGRVVIHWEAAYPNGYRIELSDDRSTWQEIYTTTSADGGVDELRGLSGTGRYIRLHATERATQWGVSPWEFEVYGVPSDQAPEPPDDSTTPTEATPTDPAPTPAPPEITPPPITEPAPQPPTVGAAGTWSAMPVYNWEWCLGHKDGTPTAGGPLVVHPCDSEHAAEGRFVRVGSEGYGQVQIGNLCLRVDPGNDTLRTPVAVDTCGTGHEFQWSPADWRWGQESVTLRSRHNDLCIAAGDGERADLVYVQDLCNPNDDRSQLLADGFAAGLMAKDNSLTPVDATFHGTLNFNSFHEGSYPMDSWTYGDVAFYAPPGDITGDMANEYLAWYSHMDSLHRRVWNQDNFDSVYRANDPNHGRKKVTAIIDIGKCSCGSKQQAEILGFKNWIMEDPHNWMYHWVMFYEMNRGGPTPNFYARATWPNTHQGGLILPHMMAGLAFYEIGGPTGLDRDAPGDILRGLTAWEYKEGAPPLAQEEIPADVQMGILLKVLQERGTDTFIDVLHNMSEKPDATNATQALCDFRKSVNDATGGAYDNRMTNDWRLPTSC